MNPSLHGYWAKRLIHVSGYAVEFTLLQFPAAYFTIASNAPFADTGHILQHIQYRFRVAYGVPLYERGSLCPVAA
jgi:hypothetical protein